MQKRHLLLAAALVVTLASTWWAASAPDEKAGPAPAAASRSATSPVPARTGPAAATEAAQAAPPPLVPALYTRPTLTETPAPQMTLAWGPPPPPPPPVMPKGYKPPPPPPPPLPFQVIGKLDDGGVTTVFLLAPDRTYAAKAGDTINNNYRVEEVTPQHIVFTFLPLKARQELSLDAR